jgi:hypothetical protein
MNATLVSLDFKFAATKAKLMTDAGLVWSANDCVKAAEAADAMELAGCRVSKTGGYYRDEAGVYRAELAKRAKKAA